jgi:WD repeat-containing protein 89
MISPFKLSGTSLTTFSQRTSTNEDSSTDNGEYVFDVERMLDGNRVVSSVSDNSLVLSDTASMRILSKVKAHKSTINRIETSKVSTNLIFSASDDKKVSLWDSRVFTKSVMDISLGSEVHAVSVGVEGSLLAASSETTIYFYDIRFATALDGNPTGEVKHRAGKLGTYSDVHSDTITQLKFHPTQGHLLASASEDGLVSVYDTSTNAEEDAIMSILNTECPVMRFGFFGTGYEGIYSISTIETLSFWHFPSAQRISCFPNIRSELGVDYLVEAFSPPNSNDIYLLAGLHSGNGVVAKVEPDRCSLFGVLEGGHAATIRCASAGYGGITGGGFSIITGGEDARLCNWVPATAAGAESSQAAAGTSSSVGGAPRGPHAAPPVQHARVTNIGGGKSSGSHSRSSVGRIKSESSSHVRFKPY